MLQPTLDEIEAVGAQGGMMTGVPTGFTDLDRLLNGLHAGQLIIVAGRPGLGKALALDTPLPTPAGWTTMGEVRAGDRLLGADGRRPRRRAFEVMHGRPCYEVEFSDGSVIVADAEHLWRPRPGQPRQPRTAPLSRPGAACRRALGRTSWSLGELASSAEFRSPPLGTSVRRRRRDTRRQPWPRAAYTAALYACGGSPRERPSTHDA